MFVSVINHKNDKDMKKTVEIMNEDIKQQEQQDNGVLQCVSGSLQPFSAVMEFAKWCKENNDILKEKGCDVLGCVKEWELSLIHSRNNR